MKDVDKPSNMKNADIPSEFKRVEFRDPVRGKLLCKNLFELVEEIGSDVSIMHVCGSHEQSIFRFGLRSLLPKQLNVIMGPGCPVCVTDVPEVDEAVYLARKGVTITTFGDMLRVPGSAISLADARAEGADVRVVFSPNDAANLACSTSNEVVFFAAGFETTAVATASVILNNPPANFSVLSVHKYIPPVMEIIAEMPHTRVQGFLAAGHAATITGWKLYERFVQRHAIPVVTAGFEPLDLMAAMLVLLELVRDGKSEVLNAYPRCCTANGNLTALKALWEVFETEGGTWRGIAHIPNGNLRIRSKYSWVDTRQRFDINLGELWDEFPPVNTQECICGQIMSGLSAPGDCALFGKQCTPSNPVGACMVSNEGTCKIWYQYGGHPKLNVGMQNERQ